MAESLNGALTKINVSELPVIKSNISTMQSSTLDDKFCLNHFIDRIFFFLHDTQSGKTWLSAYPHAHILQMVEINLLFIATQNTHCEPAASPGNPATFMTSNLH